MLFIEKDIGLVISTQRNFESKVNYKSTGVKRARRVWFRGNLRLARCALPSPTGAEAAGSVATVGYALARGPGPLQLSGRGLQPRLPPAASPVSSWPVTVTAFQASLGICTRLLSFVLGH